MTARSAPTRSASSSSERTGSVCAKGGLTKRELERLVGVCDPVFVAHGGWMRCEAVGRVAVVIFARVEVGRTLQVARINSDGDVNKQSRRIAQGLATTNITMDTPPSRSTRRRLHADAGSMSPARNIDDGDGPGTPGPTRARIANLEKQVQELVRKYQAEQVGCVLRPRR